VDNILWTGPPNDPLFLHIANQAASIDLYDRWLLRLVDVPAALAGRGYPPSLALELHLDVRDTALARNAGRLVVAIAGGRAEVERGGDGRVVADVRGLAPLYSGYLPASELAASGLLAGPNAGLAALELAFGGAVPWMPDDF